MGPPVDPVTAGDAGAHWTTALVKRLAKRHRDKKLRLIERKDNYQIANEAEKSESFRLYRRFIRNPTVLSWASTGLTLRLMEADEVRRGDVKFIRTNLRNTQGRNALHVAELAQSTALDFILLLIATGKVHVPPTRTIDDVLAQIDQYAVFVKETDDAGQSSVDADVKALAFAPFVFIVLGRWTARDKAAAIYRGISRAMEDRGYSLTELVDDRQAVGVFYKT